MSLAEVIKLDTRLLIARSSGAGTRTRGIERAVDKVLVKKRATQESS